MRSLLSKLVVLKEQENANALNGIAESNKEISWGNQIRSYVFHPYTMVKDHRTRHEVGNVADVMDGALDGFMQAYLHFKRESLT